MHAYLKVCIQLGRSLNQRVKCKSDVSKWLNGILIFMMSISILFDRFLTNQLISFKYLKRKLFQDIVSQIQSLWYILFIVSYLDNPKPIFKPNFMKERTLESYAGCFCVKSPSSTNFATLKIAPGQKYMVIAIWKTTIKDDNAFQIFWTFLNTYQYVSFLTLSL